MTLGDIVRNYRKEHGLSMKDFADLCGLSKAYISILERNYNPTSEKPPIPSLETIRSISKAIGWDFNDILSALDNKQEVSLDPTDLPINAIPYTAPHKAPIVGSIPAGYPALAFEDIEGYADIPYSDVENYFFLRVKGDSMVGAGIREGDLVLIRKQSTAEDGQIVAARVNGDEATLKRFKRQGDIVLLLPENQAYDPRIIPIKDFETGYAAIIGIALEFRHTL